MPKINQSPKQPPEKRRRQLLDAAQKLFIRKGYRSTTTEEIARKAGLTKGAFYHHFRNKEDILTALFEQMGCHYMEALDSLFARPVFSPTDLLETLFKTHKSKDLSEFLNMIDIWVQARRLPDLRKLLERQRAEFMDLVSTKIDPAYGRTAAQRREVAAFTMMYYDGLAASKAMHNELIDLPAQQALFARCMETLKKDMRKK
jgi:AcrR family transcriptional regulator